MVMPVADSGSESPLVGAIWNISCSKHVSMLYGRDNHAASRVSVRSSSITELCCKMIVPELDFTLKPFLAFDTE
jgi:hypothetical protein